MAAKKPTGGRLSPSEFRDMINKAAGQTYAYDLTQENPTQVPFWISTGSTILDRTTRQKAQGGIPANKIIEIAGEEGVGKSYLCATIAYHAQKDHDMDIFLFDSENAIDPEFLQNQGLDVSRIVYVQAKSVEFVLGTIDRLLAHLTHPALFIWDSVAMTPVEKIVEGEINPDKDMGTKARVLAQGMSKLAIPQANAGATLIATNQLKKPLSSDRTVAYKMQMGVIDLDTRHAPGGKSLPHSYSLRIWLTKSSTKSGKILDENENQIGANVQAKIIKSRFGTENRICRFGLSWGGGRARIIEEDAWLEYCKKAGVVTVTGAWMNFDLGNGQDPIKFRQKEWTEILEKPGVMDRVLWAQDQELIHKFDPKKSVHDEEEAMLLKQVAALMGDPSAKIIQSPETSVEETDE